LVIPEYIINLQNKSKKTLEKIEFIKKLKDIKDLENENKKITFKKPVKKKIFYKKKFK